MAGGPGAIAFDMFFDRYSKNASGSYDCILVQSVQLADGTLYSIIKVQDNGTIDVQVTTGSKFEVVTPSAIVGVRGGYTFYGTDQC